jgi:hypothetical protein
MESVYHIVTVCVNETSWAHIWRLHSRYLGTGYDKLVSVRKEEPKVGGITHSLKHLTPLL